MTASMFPAGRDALARVYGTPSKDHLITSASGTWLETILDALQVDTLDPPDPGGRLTRVMVRGGRR